MRGVPTRCSLHNATILTGFLHQLTWVNVIIFEPTLSFFLTLPRAKLFLFIFRSFLKLVPKFYYLYRVFKLYFTPKV